MKKYNVGDRLECDLSFTSASLLSQDEAPVGTVRGIASTSSVDLYGHQVVAGAFDASIRRKGLGGSKGVQLLAYHDWDRPAGVIKKLETVGQNLQIEAQLYDNVSYVKDLYEVCRQNNGLNFSVGFMLEEFDFNEDAQDGEPTLIVKSGDLMEVSVVVFPAQQEAAMTYVKQEPPASLAEFEKALMARGLCRSRNDAMRITQAVRTAPHLFTPPPSHPLMDVSRLQAATDLAVKVKALLGSG